jgi:hypothetical protein
MEDGRGKRIKKGEERGEDRAKEEGRWKREDGSNKKKRDDRREKREKEERM